MSAPAHVGIIDFCESVSAKIIALVYPHTFADINIHHVSVPNYLKYFKNSIKSTFVSYKIQPGCF